MAIKKTRQVIKSAKDGEFKTEQFLKENPNIAYKQTIKIVPPKKQKPK